MYFNINFNVFFKLIKVHLLVSELYSKSSLSVIVPYTTRNFSLKLVSLPYLSG